MDAPKIWQRDPAGVWHWRGSHCVPVGGVIQDAAAMCLDGWPASFTSPSAWFWWQDSFCPVVSQDTVSKLVDRWQEWREPCHRSVPLLSMLTMWSHTRPALVGAKGQLEILRTACVRAYELGSQGAGGAAAGAIWDAFQKAGLGEPVAVRVKRLSEHGHAHELDADAIMPPVDYGTERLWILSSGLWDCRYVVRTGLGRHMKLTGITREQAAAWLERAGLPVTYLPEEPST